MTSSRNKRQSYAIQLVEKLSVNSPAAQRKLKKFKKNPRVFFRDAWTNIRATHKGRPSKMRPSNAQEMPLARQIKETELFDSTFYLRRYQDVARSKNDPLSHYIRWGAEEGRAPNAFFDHAFYEQQSGTPQDRQRQLLHYSNEGERAGLLPSAGFHVPEPAERYQPTYLSKTLRKLRAPDSTAAPNGSTFRNASRQEVTIAIPVFNGGVEIVEKCLRSLWRFTPKAGVQILLLDDASTDETVITLLRNFSASTDCQLRRNTKNIGFTKNVNQALLECRTDIVLLNSDTEVGPRWLEELRCAAYQTDTIATSTALSDSAGVFSTPEPGPNDTRAHIDVPTAARLSRRSATAPIQEVPTGNGFCMYIKYAAIKDVGNFDDHHFPRGYGEENDWCMRANEHGWKHVIALRSYVRHVNAASFGSAQKRSLVAKARTTLDQLHPTYSQRVQEFHNAKQLTEQRKNFSNSLNRKVTRAAKPRCLFVVSTSTGGTPQTNRDLMGQVKILYDPLLFGCDSTDMTLSDCGGPSPIQLRHHRLRRPIDFLSHRSDEYDQLLANWLQQLDVELVHIRHIGWHSLGIIEVCASLGIPIVFSFHDFYCSCPSVNLVDGGTHWRPEGISQPHIIAPLWTNLNPDGVQLAQQMDGEDFLQMWRRKMSNVLSRCDAFVTTTQATKSLLQEQLPFLQERDCDFHVVPHGRTFAKFSMVAEQPRLATPLKILIPGNISDAKGAATIVRLTKLDTRREFEFHILGNCITVLRDNSRIIKHGAYSRDTFSSRVEEIAPSVSLIISIWPETFCHTLTESLSCGVPVVGSELGAIGQRLVQSDAGWIVDPYDADAIYRLLLRLKATPSIWRTQIAKVKAWQHSAEALRDTAAMASDYFAIYANATASCSISQLSHIRDDRKRIALIADGSFPNVPPTAYNRLAGPTRIKSELYDFVWQSAEDFLRTGCRGYAAAILCRLPGSPELSRVLAQELKRHQIPYIHDIDDQLIQTTELDHLVSSSKDTSSAVLRELARSASIVTTTTSVLATQLELVNMNVRVLPNRLSAHYWDLPSETPSNTVPRKGAEFRILYFGSKTHADDLSCMVPALNRLRKKLNISFTVVGVEAVDRECYRRVQLPSTRYDDFAQWLTTNRFDFDLGIAPLADTQFNSCKSPIKFIEYGACGLPTMASDVGPYRETIHHEVDGILVKNTADSWYRALKLAIENRHQLRNMAKRAQARVLADYTHTTNPFEPILTAMLDSPGLSTN